MRHLLTHGLRVRALVRDTATPAAHALAEADAELTQGDFNVHESIAPALKGIYGVFSVQNFFEAGYQGEVSQGTMFADAAKATGIKHLVYSSVTGSYADTGILHCASKWEVEEHLRKIALPGTILRPVFFMQNWEIFHRSAILNGMLTQPLAPQTPLQ